MQFPLLNHLSDFDEKPAFFFPVFMSCILLPKEKENQRGLQFNIKKINTCNNT